MNNFEKNLASIMKMSSGSINDNSFEKLYPFTNENIKGYYKKFDFEDKSLLTVGSSCDQAINASFNNCHDITIMDICPYTKYYYYLKVAAIISLSYQEYLNFFYFNKKNPKDYFNINTFGHIIPVLKIVSYESYLLWTQVISKFHPQEIQEEIFSTDYYETSIIEQINPYLKNATKYSQARNNLLRTKVNFINNNIHKASLNNKYDNIWLSNIFQFSDDYETIRETIDKLYEHLNNDGKILLCYFYDMEKENVQFTSLYNALKDNYKLNAMNFTGTTSYLTGNKKIKDSILVLKKSS